MKQLLILIFTLICINVLGFSDISISANVIRPNTESNIIEKDKKGKTYWINSKTMKRHNKSCRWYGNTKSGYYTDKKVGSACGICGG